MSSPSSNPYVQFPDIFEAALEEYTKKTEKDIKSDPLFAKLHDCHSSDAVRDVLEAHALTFKQYREGHWKVQLMRQLKPIVEILSRLSTKDGLKEGIVSVRLTIYNQSLLKFIIHLQIFPPAKAIFTGIGLLLEVCTIIPFPPGLCPRCLDTQS